jgi:mannose-6-phosphate isomerase-like protein (cupin superfamily)
MGVNMRAETESRIFRWMNMFVRLTANRFVRLFWKPMTLSSLFGTPTLGGIASHVHHGQDTWTVISGEAEYHQGNGIVTHLKAGDIAIAKPGQVHGAMNSGPEPFIFVSVVAPGNAGFALAEK